MGWVGQFGSFCLLLEMLQLVQFAFFDVVLYLLIEFGGPVIGLVRCSAALGSAQVVYCVAAAYDQYSTFSELG